MSGLLGNDAGPDPMSWFSSRARKKAERAQKPGFSDTMRQNKKGKWYSVQAKADKRMRRVTGMAGGMLAGPSIPGQVVTALVMGNRGGGKKKKKKDDDG